MTAQWLASMQRTRVAAVARALGFQVAPPRGASGGVIYTSPCCGAERLRRGERHVYQGGSGAGIKQSGFGWRCFACDASGDAIDFAAYALRGARMKNLSDAQRARVREWCVRFTGSDHGHTARALPLQPAIVDAPVAPPSYPPAAALRELWNQCGRVDLDPAIAKYLQRRGLNPADLADRDLVRALSSSITISWARHWYSTGHRCIALVRNASGAACSCIARQVLDGGADPKSKAPKGYARAGLVFADELARRLLVYGQHPSRWSHEYVNDAPFALTPETWWPADCPVRIVIAEGEIDALTWTTEAGDAAEHPVAVFGVASGSWTKAIADRVPDSSHVLLATDHDDQGEKYACEVAQTFRGRDVQLSRWQVPARVAS